MERPLPTLLVLGNLGHAEMRPVADCLAEIVPSKQLIRAEDTLHWNLLCNTGAVFPDVIVVCQTWPDEYSRGDVEQLFARCPLAAVMVCCGSWCDSDGRTRDLWPPATRVSPPRSPTSAPRRPSRRAA